jgi:hypothetical protein
MCNICLISIHNRLQTCHHSIREVEEREILYEPSPLEQYTTAPPPTNLSILNKAVSESVLFIEQTKTDELQSQLFGIPEYIHLKECFEKKKTTVLGVHPIISRLKNNTYSLRVSKQQLKDITKEIHKDELFHKSIDWHNV